MFSSKKGRMGPASTLLNKKGRGHHYHMGGGEILHAFSLGASRKSRLDF